MERKSGWGRKCRQGGDPWREVEINCGAGVYSGGPAPVREAKLAKIKEETANCVRALLKDCFRDGPQAAARAQSAYVSAVQIEELGGYGGWSPDAMRWAKFRDRWENFVWENAPQPFAVVDSFDGIDLKPALNRNRGRSRGR